MLLDKVLTKSPMQDEEHMDKGILLDESMQVDLHHLAFLRHLPSNLFCLSVPLVSLIQHESVER